MIECILPVVYLWFAGAACPAGLSPQGELRSRHRLNVDRTSMGLGVVYADIADTVATGMEVHFDRSGGEDVRSVVERKSVRPI